MAPEELKDRERLAEGPHGDRVHAPGRVKEPSVDGRERRAQLVTAGCSELEGLSERLEGGRMTGFHEATAS